MLILILICLLDKEEMEKPRFRQVNWLLKYDTDPSLLIGQNMVNELQFTTWNPETEEES